MGSRRRLYGSSLLPFFGSSPGRFPPGGGAGAGAGGEEGEEDEWWGIGIGMHWPGVLQAIPYLSDLASLVLWCVLVVEFVRIRRAIGSAGRSLATVVRMLLNDPDRRRDCCRGYCGGSKGKEGNEEEQEKGKEKEKGKEGEEDRERDEEGVS